MNIKKILLLSVVMIPGFSGFTQEFKTEEGIYIGKREMNPSLSYLAPEVPSQNLTLTEVNFNKIEKREVNFVAVMEKERYRRESSYVDLDFPAPNMNSGEKSIIKVTNEIYLQERGSNYDLFTGEVKNPAYKEMRAGLFNGVYSSPYLGRRNSPFSYSPFLR